MGISGLLPLLKSIHEPAHIADFAGKTIAVDGNVWLHRGAFASAWDLALNRDSKKHIVFFMRQVQLLQLHGVTPYIVFDGEPLPIKSVTVDERRRRREEALSKGKELLARGKRREAMEYFQRAIEVTPQMIQQVVKALKEQRIQCIVAPYEADAQLAYLIQNGKADAVLTEDSDLLVFGCHTVFFKMNKDGKGITIRQQNFGNTTDVDLKGWDASKIRHMCILSGCDYLPSLPGIGLRTAHKLLNTHPTIDAVLKACRGNGKMKDVPDYEDKFKRANDAFLYQFVYDPDTRRRIPLHSPPAGVDPTKMEFLGSASTAAPATLLENDNEPIIRSQSSVDSSSTKTSCCTLDSSNSTDSDTSDIRNYLESNKENIPPWAQLPDNKPPKRPTSITARDIFNGFNGPRKTTAINTNRSSAPRIQLIDPKTTRRGETKSIQTPTSLGDKSNHMPTTSLQKRKKETTALGSVNENRIPNKNDDDCTSPSSKRRSTPSSPSLSKATSLSSSSPSSTPRMTAASFLFKH